MKIEYNIDEDIVERFKTIKLIVFDFDGVFTDNSVYVMEDGTEIVRCSRSDGIGLKKLFMLGIECLILSTEKNPVVKARSRKLNIECIQGCQDKIKVLNEIAVRKNLEFSQIAFVGNDINDLECLKNVGMPIIVKDAHKDVTQYAAYITENLGGHGAVREICDLMDYIYSKY